MKRSYQSMVFATLCLAAMVSPVAVQAQLEEELGLDEIQSNANPLQVIPGAPPEIQEAAAALLDSRDSIDLGQIEEEFSFKPANEEVFVPDESWPKISFMVENWPADDPLGCK